MVRKYFIESLRLTKTNLWVLFQGTILLVVCSIFTLFLMFPTLVIGLEGMYLKAWRGETVKTIDLFMFRKRFFPLLSATIYLGLRITLSSLLIIIIFSLILVGTSVLLPITLLAIIPLFSSLGFIVFISWKQGQYLHALNLVAEGRMREYGKLLDGRLLSENRVDSAILVFFTGLLLVSFSVLLQRFHN